MSESVVLYEVKPNAVIISLNRPDRHNALNRLMVQQLIEAFRRAEQESNSRCTILTGTGSAFCAGMDLAEVAETLDQPGEAEQVHHDAKQLAALFDLIYTSSKPTLAAVNGPAVAGGAGLMTVCDLALSTPGAKFGYPEVKRGLVAAMVMPHLLRHVGERAARELLLRGNLIDAVEAKRIGLINDIAAEGQLLTMVMSWVKELAEASPQALTITKKLLQQMNLITDPMKKTTAAASADARLHIEAKEGLRAFLEKKPVPWASP